MDSETLAMVRVMGKSVRVISFNKKQAFTISGRYVAMSMKELIDLSDIPMHEDFGGYVTNVVKFSEYEWDRIQADRFNSDNDFIFLHDDSNTQLVESETGVCVWKRIE
jgi:hypothetical protein